MIRITFKEPADKAWRDWKEECATAHTELIRQVKQGITPRFSSLYKDIRLTSVYKGDSAPFHGKCAYCESDVRVNQPGDIDHWRPKSAVRDQNGCPVKSQTENRKTRAVVSREHLGYYWLAYDWTNLLLSCQSCNRVMRVNGQRVGKGAQFPVVGFRAFDPGDEVNECPLLINPMFDDPREHMEISPQDGMIIPRTERGQATIDIFGLNIRTPLVRARLRCIEETRLLVQYLKMVRSKNDTDLAKCVMTRRDQILSGTVPYSAAGRAVLEEWARAT